jgi:hypothetical protein
MKTALILALTCPLFASFGQTQIKGHVKAEQQPVPSATVLLLTTDSTISKWVVTDGVGEFIFKDVVRGEYFISVSMIGYSKYLSPPISAGIDLVTMDEIILEESATGLNAVMIEANKASFDQKIDRLVINLESSVTSAGNTVLEVLQKSPGIVVNRQNNTIAMHGKNGVRIMINEKIMQVPLDVAVQMLDGMTASNVEKIELITTPPSRYDAEGNAGIIHIITKNSAGYGTNGSVALTLGAKWAETFGGNFNINHRNKSVGWFVDYSVLSTHNRHLMNMERQSRSEEFIQVVRGQSYRENITLQENTNAGFEWKPAKNFLLNVLVTAYRRNWKLNAFAEDFNQVTNDSSAYTAMNVTESNIWQSLTGSLGAQTNLSPKSKIGFTIDYLYYNNNNPSFYDVKNEPNELSKINLEKSTPIKLIVAKTDYQQEVSASLAWETGIKVVTSGLDNNVLVQRSVRGEWITDDFFTSYSSLTERISAAYVSAKWKVGSQWQVNSGLRYEHTHTAISTPAQQNLINRKYGYWFPSLSVQKKLEPEKDFNFSFSRRTTRPTYNDIAPYVFFWGTNSFSAGNTSLYPAVANAVSAGYHLRQWMVSLQFSHIKKEITMMQPELDEISNNFSYRSQNMKFLNTLALTNVYTLTIASWWDMQTNFMIQYQVGRTAHLVKNVKLDLLGLNFNIVNTIKLPKDFAVEVSAMYQSTTMSGISRFLPLGALNAGIQKDLGKKGTFRLAIDDVLNTNNWRIRTALPENNLHSYFHYQWHNRFIRLTYRRNFGSARLQAVRPESGSEEERKRVE